jgi:uncharacterized protein with NRDE domain
MCTVSYISSGSKVVITSNRDEQVSRPALVPCWYNINGKELLFPKDTKAGGTWFATDRSGNIGVLLNGSGQEYARRPKYQKSRGLALLDVLSNNDPLYGLEIAGLEEVEPFTLILCTNRSLYQLLWNGQEKQLTQLDPKQNYIWSSSTLYSVEQQGQRVIVFKNFLKDYPGASAEDIFALHAQKDTDASASFIINRDNTLKTLSITQLVLGDGIATFKYNDLSAAINYSETLLL